MARRDRLVVRTLRCGRNNPGSNPGHGNVFANANSNEFYFIIVTYRLYIFMRLNKIINSYISQIVMANDNEQTTEYIHNRPL